MENTIKRSIKASVGRYRVALIIVLIACLIEVAAMSWGNFCLESIKRPSLCCTATFEAIHNKMK